MAAMLLVVPATAMAMPQAQAVVDPYITAASVFGVGYECTIGGAAPAKSTGQIKSYGSITCSRAFTLVLQVCIQINDSNTEEGWSEMTCGPPATKTGLALNTTTTGPCPTTALYRTQVLGQAYTSQGTLAAQGLLFAPPNGTAIECPLLP
jgi:hypothetical protein